VGAVISIAMLRDGAARATYYLERSAECHPSGYYLDDAEPSGRWCGHGASALGLRGAVTGEQGAIFTGLLEGRSPDGTQVAGPVLRRDPKGPEDARIDIRRCGIDLVVSAPKSVSVLYALADPSAAAAAVVAAHEAAVEEALGYLERHAGHGVRGHQGGGQRAARIETDGLVAAAFTHRTSRAEDPQLHTHLVVANLLHGADGKWTAVDSRAMYLHARTAGCIYQAALRGELTKRLGVGWGPVRRGVAEITGIAKPLRKEFSTRRQAIEDELERTGTSGRKAAQRAAYVTRPAKTHAPQISLRAEWAERAIAAGHPAQEVIDRTLEQTTSPAWPEISRVADELFGPDGLTKQATSFDRRDVIQTLTETLPAGVAVTARQLEAAADQLVAQEDVVPLLRPAAGGNDRRWSTRELLASEQCALSISGELTAVPAMTPSAARAAVTRRTLSSEQQSVVTGLLTSPDLVDVIVGPAGSGKTAALRAAADAWRTQSIAVIGCSLAAVTARRLEAATGVPCASIARTLSDLDRPDSATGEPAGLAPPTVVLVDEASMVGTRQYVRLASHVRAVGGKVVLVGDPAQLAEVDAGGLFAAMIRRREPLSLTGNQRQRADWERTALTTLRDGDADGALAEYVAHDRVHVHLTPGRTRRQLAADYLDHRNRHDDPYAVVALAPTRREVARLNTTIREQLRTDGQIGPDAVIVSGEDDDRRYASGDLVIVTSNDHRAGLLNGTRATITAADPQQLSLCTDSGEQITVTTGWAADHLDHGYAMTVHKAQGLTTQVALLYGASALCQQASYVALSRGREANHVYTSLGSLQLDHAGVDIGSDTEDLACRPADVVRALAEFIHLDRRQVLASDQQPLYAEPRAGTRRPNSRYPMFDPHHGRASGRTR
jgi:conjugative relaxase-like TrwC/TraI family protein